MSDKLQTLDTIKPLSTTESTTSQDAVQSEYEEGKKCLAAAQYGQAAVALHNALVAYEERQDEAGVANASNQLGHVCFAREDFDNALLHYQRAYSIVSRENDRMSMLAVLKTIAETQAKKALFQEAIDTSFEMLDLYRDNRDPQGTVNTLEMIADIYIAAGQNKKAADTYRTIASVHRNFKHQKIADSFLEKAETLECAN